MQKRRILTLQILVVFSFVLLIFFQNCSKQQEGSIESEVQFKNSGNGLPYGGVVNRSYYSLASNVTCPQAQGIHKYLIARIDVSGNTARLTRNLCKNPDQTESVSVTALKNLKDFPVMYFEGNIWQEASESDLENPEKTWHLKVCTNMQGFYDDPDDSDSLIRAQLAFIQSTNGILAAEPEQINVKLIRKYSDGKILNKADWIFQKVIVSEKNYTEAGESITKITRASNYDVLRLLLTTKILQSPSSQTLPSHHLLIDTQTTEPLIYFDGQLFCL